MTTQTSTFWLLDGRTGWRTATGRHVTVGSVSGIRLAADPAGPLDPAAGDGSMGGAVLPGGMALDAEGTVYLLDRERRCILRFAPGTVEGDTGRFEPLPTVGGLGREVRQFRDPTSIAICGPRLYVTDPGNRRVQVFAVSGLGLLHVFGPDDWAPVAVACHGRFAWVLDARPGLPRRVWRHRAGATALELVAEAADRAWTRIAADRQGRVYLVHRLAGDETAADVLECDGQLHAIDPGELRDRFDPAPILVDAQGRFCLPAELARACDRRLPASRTPPEAPLAHCRPGAGGLLFDRHGQPAAVVEAELPGPRLYHREGRWFSQALDSELTRCQWHRIELGLGNVPAGTSLTVSTYADDDLLDREAIQWLPEDLWRTRHTMLAPDRAPGAPPGLEEEFLVQSRGGRFLWLRLELHGDGYTTPAVRSITVHFPRRSYLEYLPAIYSEDDDSRWFLERFLAVFQTEWEELEDRIDAMERHYDPDAVPAQQLAELARWLGLPLEDAWSAEQQRRLLVPTPAVSPRRGTPDGLRRHVRAYLENLSGRTLDASRWPVLVEGFREREHLILSRKRSTELGRGAPLWGPGVVERLQLGTFAREGAARLVSTRDPERDVFHEHAHRFRVFVPAAWVRTAEQERMLRRAITAEKPAHTAYDLCLVEPRFRVGVQSTVGIDTVVSETPLARLACHPDPHRPGACRHDRSEPAPSRPPRQRLGYDTVLACRPTAQAELRVGRNLRVGSDAKLT